MFRTLTEIEEDLRTCEQYVRTGTLPAGFQFSVDLAINLLALVAYVRKLERLVDQLLEEAYRVDPTDPRD